jgi:stalled ribosome rescue protein Dom34
MSNHYHAIVWIDHHEAKIFQFDSTEVDATTIHSTHPHEHIHHKANARDSGHAPVDTAYLQQVARALQHAGVVLVTGPASAKKELVTYMEREYPALASRIAAVQALDHPTDGELVKLAREFFVADDRMRSQLHS